MIIHPRQGVEKDLVNAGVASANEERRLGLNLSELWLIGMSFFLLLLFLVIFLFFLFPILLCSGPHSPMQGDQICTIPVPIHMEHRTNIPARVGLSFFAH